MEGFLYRSNDNLLVVHGLRTLDEQGEEVFLDDDATVTITLTLDGLQVSGQTWPTALEHRVESDGDFEAVLVDTLVLPTSGTIRGTLIVDNGTDQHAEFLLLIPIQSRDWSSRL